MWVLGTPANWSHRYRQGLGEHRFGITDLDALSAVPL
jgi:hypothetical protein